MQPDTFEAVRINVFSVLAELAQLFNEEQLDFLFNKFESSAAKCTSDNKQGMLLLFRLAKVDTQASFSVLASATSLQAADCPFSLSKVQRGFGLFHALC